jgi:hypothetical protein
MVGIVGCAKIERAKWFVVKRELYLRLTTLSGGAILMTKPWPGQWRPAKCGLGQDIL